MQRLTVEGTRVVEEIAKRHGVSTDAVSALLGALARGNGTQAQFNHPDLGGMGQWSRGGMIMVGDMFNRDLKQRVDSLCTELSRLLQSQPDLIEAEASSGDGSEAWWPKSFGSPTSQGAQNDMRYAWFAEPRRLFIRQHGKIAIYDTGEHRISGASQQQSGDQSLTLTSQLGAVRLADLPAVAAPDTGDSTPPASPPPKPHAAAPSHHQPTPASGDDHFAKIERLADLHKKGILTDEEYFAKKAELLGRI